MEVAMKIDRGVRTIVLATASGVLIAMFVGGIANAINSAVFRYSTPRVGYFSVSAMAFAPDDNISAGNFAVNYPTGQLSGGGCFNAGVHLPQGAKMTGLSVWFSSTSASAMLLRHRLINGVSDEIVSKTGITRAGTFDISDPALEVIDNIRYGYGFAACPGNGVFLGARIRYTYSAAGD
jgi:hypothetical protein